MDETPEEQTVETHNGARLMLPDPDASLVNPAEFATLVVLLANSYRHSVEFQRREMGKSLPEAMAAVAEPSVGNDVFLASCRDEPPDQVSWWSLRALEDGREGDSLRKWEEVKAYARDELSSGMRGVAAVENIGGSGTPLLRARYAVLIREMSKDWEPLSGIEHLLIEQMAQAYTLQLYWTEQFSYYSTWKAGKVDKEAGRWEPPQVSGREAVADAAAMVDRWNRMFLRCLRQLRDLRRYSPVVINNPGQVNVGQQQVNVAPQTVDVAPQAVEAPARSFPRAWGGRAKRRLSSQRSGPQP